MKFYAIGDLHGVPPKKPKEDFDAVLCTGDLGDFKKIRELIFKEHSGEFKEPWYDEIGRDKAEELIDHTIKTARKVIKKINSWRKPVLIVPGNVDLYGDRFLKEMNKQSPYYWDYYFEDHFKDITRGCKQVFNLELQRGVFKEFTIIGYGMSSGPEGVLTEKGLVLEAGYQQIVQKLEAQMKMAKGQVILLSHNVPNETKLDLVKGEHLGSNIVRYLIEKYQPLMCVAGHIHEGQGKQMIGKTLCVNAGHGAKGQSVFITINDKIKTRFVK